jgi:6-phosphogluconolactonase (cycloisomerase 2 family)
MRNVFVQTNEAAGNHVVAFRRADDGSLEPLGRFETGGRGDGVPHLTSQGSVVLTSDGRGVLVTNAGSGELTLFAIADGGLELLATVDTGTAPKSVAEHGGLVYVLNTGEPSLVGFRIDGGLMALAGSRRELGSDADPAQVGFTPDGASLVVTERGTDSIVIFPVLADGHLGEPRSVPSVGPTPYGFAFAGGDILVVTEAFGAEKGKAAASSYALGVNGAAARTRSVGNGRSEICWAVVSGDGRYVFTTNFADGAVSRYAVGEGGMLALEDAVAGVTVDGRAGIRDEDLTADGRFLYAIDADAGTVFGWAVDGEGRLTPVGSWNGLPVTAAGLAAS